MAENEKKVQEAAAEEKETKAVTKAKEDKPAKAKAKSDKPSVFARMAAWCRSTKAELKKVVWTPRKAVVRNTGLTLAAVAVFAMGIGLLDYIFSAVINGLSRIF